MVATCPKALAVVTAAKGGSQRSGLNILHNALFNFLFVKKKSLKSCIIFFVRVCMTWLVLFLCILFVYVQQQQCDINFCLCHFCLCPQSVSVHRHPEDSWRSVGRHRPVGYNNHDHEECPEESVVMARLDVWAPWICILDFSSMDGEMRNMYIWKQILIKVF